MFPLHKTNWIDDIRWRMRWNMREAFNAFKHTPLTDASSEISFKHIPLDNASREIRLFELAGLSQNNTPKLRLQSCRLDEFRYTAISYVWGNPTACRAIIVNGCVFNVTENALYALQQIWNQHANRILGMAGRDMITMVPRYFWMDTICINQQDLKEKAFQVEPMGDIFENAANVFACVGPHENHSELVIDIFGSNAIGPRAERVTVDDQLAAKLRKRDKNKSTSDQLAQAFYSTFSEALLELCNRKYWRRMWIVQVTRLAAFIYLYCGYDVLPLHCMMLYIWPVLDSPSKSGWLEAWIKSNMAAVLAHSKHANRTDGRPQMAADVAFRNLYNSECSDFHDRVYALLRIIEWNDRISKVKIRPNYELTKVGLMRQVAHAVMEAQMRPSLVSSIMSNLCRALRLTVDDPEISAMLNSRRHTRDDPGNPVDEVETLRSGPRMIVQASPLSFRLHFCKNGLGLRIEDCGTPKDDECRVFKEMMIGDSRYRSLSIDERPVGWTCQAARSGDYLIADYLVGEVAESPGIPCLIVRDSGPIFRIIGHAILKREGYPIGKSLRFTVRFDIEDYIAIVAFRSSKISDGAMSARLSQLLDSSPTWRKYSSFAIGHKVPMSN